MKDKVITSIMQEVADEYGLTLEEVEAIYESQWDFIAETVEDIDFTNVTKEEFKDLKTNFNIPAIGKFYTNYYKVRNVREKSREVKERESSGNDVQPNPSNSGEEEINI